MIRYTKRDAYGRPRIIIITEAEAIEKMKAIVLEEKGPDFEYSDEQALKDFMTTQWATIIEEDGDE